MGDRLLQATARWLSDHVRSEQILDWFAAVQSMRGTIEDVEGAMLHFAALPSRADVRRLQRKVISLRRRVAELDRAVSKLEMLLSERRP